MNASDPVDSGISADEYCERLVRETREELVRADSKAFAFFSLFGVITAVLLATLVRGQWNPGELGTWESVLFWIGFCLIGCAVLILGAAVWPRFRGPGGRGVGSGNAVTFFGDIRGEWSAEDLSEAIEATVSSQRELDVEKLLQVSIIVQSKYRLIRTSLMSFLAGIILCAVSLVANAAH